MTLFGPRVPTADAKKPAAWRSAIAKARFDPKVRYRLGEPWRPRTVTAESTKGAMPRAEMRARIDELIVRTGVRPEVDLARWAPDAWGAALRGLMQLEKQDGQYPPGTWTTRAR
jgi:hypothetical protein